MRKLLSSLILTILLSSSAFAQPNVSGTGGSLSHGMSQTISGSSFGIKSPAAPLYWETAESKTNGTQMTVSGVIIDVWPSILTQDGGAANLRYRTAPYRNVSAPHSNSTKLITGGHDDEGECLGGEPAQNVIFAVGDGSSHNDWYVHFYYRLDPLWPAPGAGHNYKEMWWNPAGGTMTNTAYDNQNDCNNGKHPLCGESYVKYTAHGAIDGESCGCGYPDYCSPSVTGNVGVPNPFSQWVNREYVYRYASIFFYKASANNVVAVDTSLDGGCGARSGGPWYSVSIGGFWREALCDGQDDLNDNAWRYFDDIYVDTTFSRVMLCNNATYTNATICEPQIPSAWADGGDSITVTVNQGALSVGTNYLFVFDSNNVANSTGYPVTIGSGGSAQGCTISGGSLR